MSSGPALSRLVPARGPFKRLRRLFEGIGNDPDAPKAPAWKDIPDLSTESLRAVFDREGELTVGAEEELMLVDPDSLALSPRVGELLAALDGDERFTRELREAQFEIVSPVCQTAADVHRELEAARRLLLERAPSDLWVAASGSHPFSTDWGPVSGGERYGLIADEYTWAASRSLACGLHVHVHLGGADRSLAVYNALRSYLPELGALATNSPFFEGQDTGLASVRPKLMQAFPRSGVPPAWASWEELSRFVAWAQKGQLFPDMTHFWWELRLHPLHGTIELRVADTQTAVADAAGIVAVYQCLAVQLGARYDAGEPLKVHDSYWINENNWRALRYGVHGVLSDLDSGEAVPTRERLYTLLDSLEPEARRLDCQLELAQARTLISGNGADRQRYVAEREGLDGLVRWLVKETARLEPEELLEPDVPELPVAATAGA